MSEKETLRTVKDEQDRFLEWTTNQTFHSIETIKVQVTALVLNGARKPQK